MSDDHDVCESCEPTRTIRRWGRWALLLVSAVLASLLTLAGMTYSAGATVAQQASAIRELERIDAAASVERTRLSVESVRAEREQAQRWAHILAALARIETQLEARAEQQRGVRR
jgi:hypothetical protein